MARKKERQKRRQRKTYRPPTRHQKAIPDEKTLFHSFLELESLGDEVEFADFRLTEDVIPVISEMIASTDEEITRLEKLGDEQAISELIKQASMNALDKVVTPQVKDDIYRRLERLSHRLRKEGQNQRADSIAALTFAIEFPYFPWPLFTPLTRAFGNLVQQTLDFLVIEQAIVKAAHLDVVDLRLEDLSELLEDPEILNQLEAQCKTDEVLQEAIDNLFDQMYDVLNKDLLSGKADLKLFTDEELATGLAWYGYETEKGNGIEATDESESQHKVRVIYEASRKALTYLNTPDRRQRWLNRLEQNLGTKTWTPDLRVGLQFLKSELSQPSTPDDPGELLLHAYIGELIQTSKRLDKDDSPEAQAQERLIQEIEERLERGGLPLAAGS